MKLPAVLLLALAMLPQENKVLADDTPAATPGLGDYFRNLFTPQPPDPQRGYQPLRYDEDWRWLKNGTKDPDLFDPIKYIPLSPSGDLSLDVGGSARLRYEYKANPAFGATNAQSPTPNDDYFLERAYIHTDFRYLDFVRVFVEGVFSYIDGEERHPPPTPFPSDDADLHQAFLDISPFGMKQDQPGVTLRMGRQELLFDRQKLVGPLDWANTRRAFDGAAALFQAEQYKAEVFWVRPVQVNPKSFDTTDEQANFIGAYLTHPMFNANNHFSLYAYYLNRTRDTKTAFLPLVPEFNPDGQKGNTDRVTAGARFWGSFLDHFDYDIEGGPQFGRLAQNNIFAGYVSAELGYTFADVFAQPRLSIGYDYATGDSGRGGNESNTFDQLFPTGHLYFGYLDLVGRQNIDAGNLTLSATPLRDLKLWTSWHYFALASPDDALYNASSQATRFSSNGNAGTYVGNELDISGSYQLGRHTTLLFGYGIFFTGDYIRNTGKSDIPQLLYTSLEFKF